MKNFLPVLGVIAGLGAAIALFFMPEPPRKEAAPMVEQRFQNAPLVQLPLSCGESHLFPEKDCR